MRWLERISQRVDLHPNRIFPTEELLDHVPILILGIATYVEDPGQPVSADTPVIAKAMELGALRHSQGFDEYELLKEYEIFGGILYSFLASAVDEIDQPCTRSEVILCAHRLYHAISLIQQATTTQFLALMKERISEREDRLRAFNRTSRTSSATASARRWARASCSRSRRSPKRNANGSSASSCGTWRACASRSTTCSS